jgi:predicted RNA-binding protein
MSYWDELAALNNWIVTEHLIIDAQTNEDVGTMKFMRPSHMTVTIDKQIKPQDYTQGLSKHLSNK